MAYDVTYNADFNILATITAPLFKSTDPNIKLDTNATLSLANLMASHINRRYKAVPTKVGTATVRLDSAYGSAPIQEFVKEKVANGYIYSVRFNVAWEIFGATIDVSSRIDNDQSALDECDLEWEWRCSNCNHDLMEHYEDLDIKTPEELGLLYCPHCGARILGTRYRKDDDGER